MRNFSLIVILFISGFVFQASGAFLRNIPQSLVQPDGSILNCFASGDEFHNWLHDEDNFTIIKDPETGFYVFAGLEDGKLVPSQWIAGKVEPAAQGLSPGLNISAEEYTVKKLRKTNYTGLKSINTSSNTGLVNNLVIFIRYSDQEEFAFYNSYFENVLNGTDMVSMKSYFNMVSDKQLDINSHLYPQSNISTVISYQDSHPRNYYQAYNAATNIEGYRTKEEFTHREHTLLKDATEFVRDEVESSELDLDMNDDGYVDNILFVVKGNTEGWSDMLWPHKWELFSYDIYLKGAKVWMYNFQLSETFNVGILCHEMFHSLGAPDLYRYSNKTVTPVGPWDLMAETTAPPQQMGVYMKMKYGGWLSSIPSITSTGTYTLESLVRNPFAAFKIPSPNSSSEYFVLEYRAKTGQFESSIPGSGLVIYRVNQSSSGNSTGPPDELYVFRPNGTNTNNGDVYLAHFSDQASRTRFSDNTNPSCFLSNGSDGGIEIRNIGTAGTSISFDVLLTGEFKAPRSLTASASGPDVRLNWQKPSDGTGQLTGFKVFRNGNLIATIENPDANSFSDEALADGSYNYYLTAIYASPEGESSGSNEAIAVIGSSGKPDLLITEPEVDPLIVDPGGTLNVSCKLVNNGTGKAGSSMFRLSLSRDQIHDQEDIVIAYGAMEALEPGKFLDITGDGLEVPAGTDKGRWYLLFVADADQQMAESNEDNNIKSRVISLGASGFEPPRNLNATADGNNVSLKWQLPDQGNGILTGFKIYRNGTRLVSLPGAGKTEYSDAGLPNGIYEYQITALYISPQGESGPSNEVVIDVSVALKPDLMVANPQISFRELLPGESFDVTGQYLNIGKAPAPESVLKIFLSIDTYLDNADIQVAQGTMDPLGPGQSVSIAGEQISIPDGLDPGPWFMLFAADANKEVAESNELNNVSYTDVSMASSSLYPPGYLNASVSQNTVTLDWQAPETGAVLPDGYKVYRNDQLIHVINNAGSRDFIDGGLMPGEYRYFVTASYSSISQESKASNIQIAIISSSSLPDLMVRDQSVTPQRVDPGGYIVVECNYLNNGSATSGPSVFSLFLSRDKYQDDNDLEIAYGDLGQLDASLYVQISAEDILIPANFPQGKWNVLFIADARQEVAESVETNNISSFEITIGSSGFNPPQNLKAFVAGRNISLEWEKPSLGNGEPDGFKVYRNGSFVAQISDPDHLVYIDAGLEPGAYEYHVTALYLYPDGESGVSNKVVVNISTDNKPDLVIRDPQVDPQKTSPGELIDLSCKLSNEGVADSGECLMLFLLSRDQVIDPGDIRLVYGAMGPISSGDYSDVSGSGIELPEGLEAGLWFIAMIADVDNEVDETNEDNNTAFFGIEIENTGYKPPVNLYASVSGTNVALTWQAPEQGSGALTGFRVYRNEMEINRLDDPGNIKYSDRSLNPGVYTYFVSAIYEDPEGESPASNKVTVEISSSGDPDLIVADAEADPCLLEPGGSISVSFFLRNLGRSTAGESVMRLYISDDEHVDNQDYELARGIMGEVIPGGFISISGRDLAIPSQVNNGIWYLIFYADKDQQVLESNENNNTAVIQLVVGESFFNPPANLQGVISNNSILLFWNTPDPGPARLTGYNIFRNNEFLQFFAPNAPQPYVDNDLAFGNYTYTLTATYEEPAGESQASNEVILAVSNENKPDLIVRNASVAPLFPDPGGVVSISCNIRNIGSSQAGYSHLRLFLSRNEELDLADHDLAYSLIEPIAPGNGLDISGEDVYIPENIVPGEWFMFLVADADGEVAESSEDNNHAFVRVRVASRKPDLMITRIYLIRDHVNPGDMMRVTYFVYNNGAGTSGESQVSFYLSYNEFIDEDDVFLNAMEIDSLSGMEQVFRNNYIRIPDNAIRRDYYLIAYIDVGQEVAETDEGNNTFAIPITVGTTGIDTDPLISNFSIFPSPARDKVFLSYEGAFNGESELSIIDASGRIMYSINPEINGIWSDYLEISGWQKGYYFVRLSIAGQHYLKTFIKL